MKMGPKTVAMIQPKLLKENGKSKCTGVIKEEGGE